MQKEWDWYRAVATGRARPAATGPMFERIRKFYTTVLSFRCDGQWVTLSFAETKV